MSIHVKRQKESSDRNSASDPKSKRLLVISLCHSKWLPLGSINTRLSGELFRHYSEWCRWANVQWMASRHRVRFPCIQIIKTATIPAKMCKRQCHHPPPPAPSANAAAPTTRTPSTTIINTDSSSPAAITTTQTMLSGPSFVWLWAALSSSSADRPCPTVCLHIATIVHGLVFSMRNGKEDRWWICLRLSTFSGESHIPTRPACRRWWCNSTTPAQHQCVHRHEPAIMMLPSVHRQPLNSDVAGPCCCHVRRKASSSGQHYRRKTLKAIFQWRKIWIYPTPVTRWRNGYHMEVMHQFTIDLEQSPCKCRCTFDPLMLKEDMLEDDCHITGLSQVNGEECSWAMFFTSRTNNN